MEGSRVEVVVISQRLKRLPVSEQEEPVALLFVHRWRRSVAAVPTRVLVVPLGEGVSELLIPRSLNL